MDKNNFEQKKCTLEIEEWKKCVYFYTKNLHNMQTESFLYEPIHVPDEEFTLDNLGITEREAEQIYVPKEDRHKPRRT